MLTRLTTLIIALLLILPAASIMADTETTAPSGAPEQVRIGAKPQGQIAFINDGNIWIMDTDGKNRYMVCEIKNARGRLSFSPDNKIIAFSREGKDANNLPSGEGGVHLLHDIFLAYVDSATTNINWWRRLTFTLGAYQPEWSADGSTVYCQNDIHAGNVDYIVPSHQVAAIEAEGGNMEYLRKDWKLLETNMILPTVSPDGEKLAFVTRYSANPNKLNFQNFGIKIIPMDSIMMPEEKLRQPTAGLAQGYAPSFSPDGKWLAYVSNDMRKPGLYIVNPDNTAEKRLVYSPPVTTQIQACPPGWSPDSKWLCFATTDGVIYTVDISGGNLTPVTGTGEHSYPAWSR